MKYLIVGLGNPGDEYKSTRHNVGFMVLDHLAEKHKVSFETTRLADKADIKYKGRSIYLIKPNTYMNLSGKAVNYWLQELKISLENLLVIVDDVAIDHAKLRLRGKGSAGGHNGLSNIEELIKTSKYARLRFGIGNDYPKGKQVDYVLGNFTPEQQKDLQQSIEKSSEMVLAFTTIGLERTMNQYNEK